MLNIFRDKIFNCNSNFSFNLRNPKLKDLITYLKENIQTILNSIFSDELITNITPTLTTTPSNTLTPSVTITPEIPYTPSETLTPNITITPTLTPSPYSVTSTPFTTANPTFSPTTIMTQTPIPTTNTPEISPTPLPTLLPANTPTPPLTTVIIVTLIMPQEIYHHGDIFYLQAKIQNLIGHTIDRVCFFVYLDINTDEYWFWPSWTHYPPYIDYVVINLYPGSNNYEIISPFQWPPDAGTAENIHFWSYITNSDITKILSNIACVTFSYY